jgi:hypothetical protein
VRPPLPEFPLPLPLEAPDDPEDPEDPEEDDEDEPELASWPPLLLPALRAPREDPLVRLVGVAVSPLPLLLEPAGRTRV